MDRRDTGVASVFSAVLDDNVDTLTRVLQDSAPAVASAHGYKDAGNKPAAKTKAPNRICTMKHSGSPADQAKLPNNRQGVQEDRDDGGATSLHLASSIGAIDCTKELLSCGADINSRDIESGWTPLHRAIYAGHVHIVLQLLAAGALLDDANSGLHHQGCGLDRKAKLLGRDFTRWRQKGVEPPCSSLAVGCYDNEGLSPLDLLTAKLLPLHEWILHEGRLAATSSDRCLRKLGHDEEELPSELWNETNDTSNAAEIELDCTVFSQLARSSVPVRHEPSSAGTRRRSRSRTMSSDGPHAPVAPTWLRMESRAHKSSQRDAAVSSLVCCPGNSSNEDLMAEQPSWLTQVATFGRSNYQLGYTTAGDTQTLPRVVEFEGHMEKNCVPKLSASRTGSAILRSDGVPLVFGVNACGRLGLGTESAAESTSSAPNVVVAPTPIPFFVERRINVFKLSLGERHACAIDSKGGLWAWGENRSGACGFPNSGLKAHLSKGKTSKAAHMSQLDVLPSCVISTPKRVEGAVKKLTVIDAAAGGDHTAVLTSDGTIWTWGSNCSGQLGQRDVPMTCCPPEVEDLPKTSTEWESSAKVRAKSVCVDVPIESTISSNPRKADLICVGDDRPIFTSISVADSYTLALTCTGEVYEAGRGISSFRRLMFDLSKAAEIDAIAAYEDASTCISNAAPVPTHEQLSYLYGSLGFRVTASAYRSDSVGWRHSTSVRNSKVANAHIRRVSASKLNAVAIDEDGNVWSWSAKQKCAIKSDIKMDDAENFDWSPPTKNSRLARAGVHIIKISAALHHTVALADTGDVFVWGDEVAAESGLLGVSSHSIPEGLSVIPRRIPNVKRAIDVVAGDFHTILVTATAIPPLPPLLPHASDVNAWTQTGNTIQVLQHPPGKTDTPFAPTALSADTVYGAILADLGSKLDVHVDAEPVGVTFFVPTLKSMCERIVAAAMDVTDATGGLIVAEEMQASGLATYCGSLICSNLDAYLASAKGKALKSLEEACSNVFDFRWNSSDTVNRERRLRAARQKTLVDEGKALKRYACELARPTAIWRGKHHAAERIRDGAINLAAPAGVRPLLAAETARDVARIRTNLFPRVVTNHSMLSRMMSTPVKYSKGRSKLEAVADDLAPTFNDAYAAITADRSPLRGTTAEHADIEAAADAELEQLRKAAAVAAAGRCASTRLPAGGSSSAQASLDRIAAKLIEGNIAPSKDKSVHLDTGEVVGRGVRAPMEQSRVALTPLMLDDAFVLLRRTKALRKKLIECTALAQQCAHFFRQAAKTKLIKSDCGLTTEQFGKVLKRADLISELWTIVPFVTALLRLACKCVPAIDPSDVTFAADGQQFIAEAMSAIDGYRDLQSKGLGSDSVSRLALELVPKHLPGIFTECTRDVLEAVNGDDALLVGFDALSLMEKKVGTPDLQAHTVPPSSALASTAPLAIVAPATASSPAWNSSSSLSNERTPISMRSILSEEATPFVLPKQPNAKEAPRAPFVTQTPFVVQTKSPAKASLREILEAESKDATARKSAAEDANVSKLKHLAEESKSSKASLQTQAQASAKVIAALTPAAAEPKPKSLSLAEIQRLQSVETEKARSSKPHSAGVGAASAVRTAWGYREKQVAPVGKILEEEQARAAEAAKAAQMKADEELAVRLHMENMKSLFESALHESRARGISKGVLPVDAYEKDSTGKLIPVPKATSHGRPKQPAKSRC
jgi:alpha-tubulin suppressor-like RCC1 family protein